MSFVSVYVTCPDADVAKAIARALVEANLVACANIVPVTSVYRWDGAIQEDAEVVMFLKTRRDLLPDVERAIVAQHPYEVPCIVALDIVAGAAPYLDWIAKETNGRTAPP